jgi:hypothetical protein
VTKGDWAWRLQSAGYNSYLNWVSGVDIAGSKNVNDAAWHYTVGTSDDVGNMARLITDGVLEVSGTAAAIPTDNYLVSIGANLQQSGREFDGLMDEVQISSTAFTTNWVWASYMNLASNSVFTTYGAANGQTTPPSRPVIAPLPMTGTNLSLRVSTVSGFNYVLESAPSLSLPLVWTPVSTNPGTGGTITNLVPIDAGTPQRFYRYQVR